MPADTVYVGRGSRYGNPFKVVKVEGRLSKYRVDNTINDREGEILFDTRDEATQASCDLFRFFLERKYRGSALTEFLSPLAGKDLACWCSEESPCHADIYLKILNGIKNKENIDTKRQPVKAKKSANQLEIERQQKALNNIPGAGSWESKNL